MLFTQTPSWTTGFSVPNLTPTVNITKNKSRLKIHNGSTVYLSDGDNFEFEIYNPTSKTVLAKISIDGQFISTSGLVVKPGQRLFLERYLDKPNKFKFSTYEVEGDNKEVTKAIANNGEVKVYFYDEVQASVSFVNSQPSLTIGSNLPITITSPIVYFGNTIPSNAFYSMTNLGNTSATNATFTTSTTDSNGKVTASGTTTYRAGIDPVNVNLSGSISAKTIGVNGTTQFTKSMETGRVEKGEKSDQAFTNSNKDFNWYSSSIVEYKILPKSQLKVEELKQFCENCGSKRKNKPNVNFCSNCGTKF